MSTHAPAVRPSGRTIAIAVTGFGAAALVTSVSALRFGTHQQAVRVAIVGGTLILAAAALTAVYCGVATARKRDRALWVSSGVALALTSAGSGLRAWGLIAGVSYSTGLAEASYVAGLAVLCGAFLWWVVSNRDAVPLWLTIAEVAAACSAAALAFWFLYGRGLVYAAIATDTIPEGQMRQFLGLLSVVTFCTVLMIAVAWRQWRQLSAVPMFLLGAAVLLMLFGDVAWLSMMVGRGWAPGSLSDFAHISGHVLIATAASLSRDDRPASQPPSSVTTTS